METCRGKRKRQQKKKRWFSCCTSDQAADSQPVNKHIVYELAACEELRYDIEVGPDASGCIQHELQETTGQGDKDSWMRTSNSAAASSPF